MKNLQLNDFREYTFISGLKYSPAGSASALVATKANDKNGYDKAIYIDKGAGYFPLTSATGNAGPYIWLDEEHILFAEARSETVQDKIEKGYEITSFHKINIHGGEAVAAFDIDADVVDIQLRPDGTFLVAAMYDHSRPCLAGKTPEEADDALAQMKKEKEWQVVDELPYWSDASGFINKKRRRLYKYCPHNGLAPITGPLDNAEAHRLSPCGQYVLFAGNVAPFEIRDSQSNLYLVDINTGETKALLENGMYIRDFDFWGEKIVLAATDGDEYGINQNPAFYILDKSGDKKHLLDYDLSINTVANSDSRLGSGTTSKVHGDWFYFTSLKGHYTEVYRLCLNTGALEAATDCGGNVSFFDICGERLIYGAMIGLGLCEVYENGVKKSAFNDEFMAGRKLSKPEYHVFADADGYEIEGWMLPPVDYEEDRPYPAILNIHGGPKTAYGDCFFHEMQYWAAQGYFVMFCNPQGSDGKGDDFADIRGKYGTVDYDNLMQFTSEMCRLYPDIDQRRLGVAGGSYGGFMTNWIVGHTHRFAAAATQRSICNWISFGYISDIGHYFGKDQMQADPWTDLEKMWWHSPLKYAPNVQTPTLILHSDQDYRCWVPEAYQFFTALKLHGVDTRLHVFRGENHELSRSGKPDNRTRRLEEITNWMDKHLK
ncbi:MAG: S9 family peptidase [Defluviitaleaceae bacterium]|nr:S9 family peptidase [Defluviitaleaceae bacterium]